MLTHARRIGRRYTIHVSTGSICHLSARVFDNRINLVIDGMYLKTEIYDLKDALKYLEAIILNMTPFPYSRATNRP